MSAKDKFHDVVKIALQKDGWQITDDPLSISVGGVDMLIDLGAEPAGSRTAGRENCCRNQELFEYFSDNRFSFSGWTIYQLPYSTQV